MKDVLVVLCAACVAMIVTGLAIRLAPAPTSEPVPCCIVAGNTQETHP